MTRLNELFVANVGKANGKRTLSGTAEMTARAETVVNNIFEALSNNFDANCELFEDSKVNHTSMDKLIEKFTNNFKDIDYDFLSAYDDEEIKQMLKSQQSKRSRSKAKEMTMDNYRGMMNAAVCEHMIRLATGKAKLHAAGKSLEDYTIEYIQSLSEDQYDLRREIRNIQSKISICKKKNPEDYEELEEYKELRRIEGMLKEMRVPVEHGPSKMHKVNETLTDVDLEMLDIDEAKQLIAKLREITGGNH